MTDTKIPERILVTGGGGLIGLHVAMRFAQQGAEVQVLDNLSRARSLPTARKESAEYLHNWKMFGREDNVRLVRGDICDRDLVVRW